MEYNVLDFGAVGNGTAADTAAIQKAIDTCCANGGGRVVFPGGHVFRCGALILGSCLELHLEMGAVLQGSDDLQDYLLDTNAQGSPETRGVPSYVNCEYTGAPNHYFLYAKGCHDLAITGPGAIDGNEEIFYGPVSRHFIDGSFYPRAPMLFLEDVERLTIREVTLRRSAFWTVHMVGCRDVLIDGIRILNNLRLANCDGIDPDHCQNVRIANCHIQCADDCIVFKNTAAAMKYGPCENITVTNCTLISTSAAIKFGSESEALFRNILVQNCAISRTNRGISLMLRDGGSIENVSFQNLTISTRLFIPGIYWGAAEPIAITVLPRKPETRIGTVKNVSFRDIFCDSENGILLYAAEPGDIRQLSFRNVHLNLSEKTSYPKGIHDLRPTFGPDFTEPGVRYLYARGVEGLSMEDCHFSADPAMGDLLVPDHAELCN